MKKEALRRYYLEQRCELTASQISKMDDLMLIQFQRLPIDIPAGIFTYAPIEKKKEFDPQLITDYCYFKNSSQQLYYPVIDQVEGKNEMMAMLVNDDSCFELNQYGIPEPVNCESASYSEIEMVIVPLLAFDESGYRVGYGKGYYDRFLQHCNPDCIKIGFSYFDPVPAIEDVNQFDIPLDFCITHEKIYAF